MKDTGDLFSKICDMDNLRKAHKNAKRGKGVVCRGKVYRERSGSLPKEATGKSNRTQVSYLRI